VGPFKSHRRRERGTQLLEDVAIRDFLATTYPRLVAAVALITGNQAAAEDAVQEALARAWERSDRGEQIDSLSAWVTRVAMNLSKSRLRRGRVESKAHERMGVQEPSSLGRVTEYGLDLERALAELPRRQREVVVLHYYLGFDVRDVARSLGISQGTVKTSLYRARQSIAAALGQNDPEEADHA
jgi:RNA polymerase sigma-70 factor, ECF subfamily